MRIIKIFDTTLRDGEQSPGASMTSDEKLKVAKKLEELKVDIIEAGFPSASKGDFYAVKRISDEVKSCTICGLSRCLEKDIDACWESLKSAKSARIHIFLASSDIHLKYKLKLSREKALERLESAIKYAKKFFSDIEYSPEDAGRTDIEYLCQVVEKAIKAGATTINIPDTVGYLTPWEYQDLIKTLFERVPKLSDVIVSCHCHNDLGLAVANSLAGVISGAGQIECTINGIGERAGNAALEEIVMAFKTRKSFFNVDTNINTKLLFETSKLVSKITGINVQRNKPIVGENAFAHEAGIHQHGILANRKTYEIMNPEDVGWKTRLILGKHSGRHAVRNKLEELGVKLDDAKFERFFEKFKELADVKKRIYDEDLMILATEIKLGKIPKKFLEILKWQVLTGSDVIPQAAIEAKTIKDIKKSSSIGNGPIDALYKAIEKLTGYEIKLLEFKIKALTSGTDAFGEVEVEVEVDGRKYYGYGRSTDIIEASIKAYIDAINKSKIK